jgi:hypothetical protein
LTPFTVAYVLADAGTPTDEQFQAASDITSAYIDEYVTAFFDFSLDTDLDSVTSAVGDFTPDPIGIGYEVTMDFAETSVFIPSKGELDNLMFSAFQEPAVQALLTLLSNLPDNPFASTTSVTYTPTEVVAEESAGSSGLSSVDTLSPVSLAAIAISCLLVASMSGLYWVKRKHFKPKKYMPAHGENGPDLPTMTAEDTMGSECSSVHTSSLVFSKTSLQKISEEDKEHSEQTSPLFSSRPQPARRTSSAAGHNSSVTPGTKKQKVKEEIYADDDDVDDAVRSCQGMGTFQQDVNDITPDDDGHDDMVEKAVLLARSRRNGSDGGNNERNSCGPSYL